MGHYLFTNSLFCCRWLIGSALLLPLLGAHAQYGYQPQLPSPRGYTSMPGAYSQRGRVASADAGLVGYGQQPVHQAQVMQTPAYWEPVGNGYPQPRPQPSKKLSQPKVQQQSLLQPMPQQYAPIGKPGMGGQPMPYPDMGPAPTPKKSAPRNYGAQIEALRQNDHLQDQRLDRLENQQSHGGDYFAPSSNETGLGRHRVVLGETLSSVAASYGISVTELKHMNNRRSDIVLTGETLIVPTKKGQGTVRPKSVVMQGGVHVVQPGESLSKIAAAYRVSVKSLQVTNGIRDADLIKPGQRLKVPGAQSSSPRTLASASKSKPAPARYVVAKPKAEKPKSEVVAVKSFQPPAGMGVISVPVSSGPRGVTSYRVENGDRIEEVAKNFSTTPGEIQRLNNLASTKLPAAGEEIVVPLPGSSAL